MKISLKFRLFVSILITIFVVFHNIIFIGVVYKFNFNPSRNVWSFISLFYKPNKFINKHTQEPEIYIVSYVHLKLHAI